MTDTPRIKPGRFFAEFAVRMFAFWLDLMLVMVLSHLVAVQVIERLGFDLDGFGAVLPFVAFLYFMGAWSSPLRATPVQWLFRMRIVDKQGETLSPARASIRAAALFGLFFACFVMLGALASPYLIALAILAYAGLYLAAVTRHRQAVHDLLAGSVVVNKTALRAFDELELQNRPSAWKMIGDAIVLIVPVCMLLFVAQTQQQRDMMYRTGYAVQQTKVLRTAIEVFHELENRWPTTEAELGVPVRGDYPDGGYYELEEDGVIRIRFEVKPELVRGSILQTPLLGEQGITWRCHQEGRIHRSHLPSACRD